MNSAPNFSPVNLSALLVTSYVCWPLFPYLSFMYTNEHTYVHTHVGVHAPPSNKNKMHFMYKSPLPNPAA